MKIVVTYEKKDILRLIQRDLQAQNIKVKMGTSLEYKGALQAKFEVETEDDAPVVGASPPLSDGAKAPAEEDRQTAVVPKQETADMSTIIGESQRLVRTQPGKFEVRPGTTRSLAPNESLEFPHEE